jgi:hypothetical protein
MVCTTQVMASSRLQVVQAVKDYYAELIEEATDVELRQNKSNDSRQQFHPITAAAADNRPHSKAYPSGKDAWQVGESEKENRYVTSTLEGAGADRRLSPVKNGGSGSVSGRQTRAAVTIRSPRRTALRPRQANINTVDKTLRNVEKTPAVDESSNAYKRREERMQQLQQSIANARRACRSAR